MDYWYEGNLNESVNRREKNGSVYYIRGVRKVNGHRMERYGVQTHFVEEGESYIRLIQDYVLPLYQPGDILSISAYGGRKSWMDGPIFKSVWP